MCVLLRENENRKPRQQILLPQSLDSRCCHSTQVIILFTNAKLSCLTARTHADETRRGVPERRGNTSKGTVGSCVLRQEGAEAKAASLRAASKLRRPCKITTLGRVVDIRT